MEYFAFDDADMFLDSISGAVGDVSPSSIGTSDDIHAPATGLNGVSMFLDSGYSEETNAQTSAYGFMPTMIKNESISWNEEMSQNNMFAGNEPQQPPMQSQQLHNNSISSASSMNSSHEDSLFNDINVQSSHMSSHSYSNESNNLTPETNISASSNHTSPTNIPLMKTSFRNDPVSMQSSNPGSLASSQTATSRGLEPSLVKIESGRDEDNFADEEDSASQDNKAKLEESNNIGDVLGSSASKTTRAVAKGKISKVQKKDKTSHNMIEKKYRTNINSKILALRDAVPSLRVAAGSKDVSLADLDGLTPASKLNKASVLTKATEYIKHLERRNAILKDQNIQLQRLIQEANLHPNGYRHVQSIPPNSAPMQQQLPPPQPGSFGYVPPQSNESEFNSSPIRQSYSNTSNNNFIYSGSDSFDPLNIPPQMGPQGFQMVPPQHQQQQYAPHQHHQQQPPQQQKGLGNKLLMGSMAAIMGTSLFGGDNGDFKGLSAIPMMSLVLPLSILHPSPVTVQLWHLVKMIVVVAALANVLVPFAKNLTAVKKADPSDDRDDENKHLSIFKNWLLCHLGLHLPVHLSDARKQQILQKLGGQAVDKDLMYDYIQLSVSEVTFENCFLTLLVGKMLIEQKPWTAKFIDRQLSVSASLMLNLEYRGEDESLRRLSTLVKDIDGLGLFGASYLIKRLINMSKNININTDINDGQNHLKYVEIYQEQALSVSGSYYKLILDWRVLDIIHLLNLSYLKNLSIGESSESILKDLKKLKNLLDEDSKLYNYYNMFLTIVDYENSQELMRDLHSYVVKSLESFRLVREGQDLTDHEILDTDDDRETSEEDYEVVTSYKPTLRDQKALISSFNLIDAEQFVVLSTSMCVKYYRENKAAEALKLLKYVRKVTTSAHPESELPSLSFISFTALLSLLDELVVASEDKQGNRLEFDETSESILDGAIKLVREWLDESSSFMNVDLRNNLLDLVVKKGMILNGIGIDDCDD